MSQLDLALAASVSARHVSFLETGRAEPSREMVLRLGATLSVPFRHQNVMLQAAGFDATFEEPDPKSALSQEIRDAIARLKEHQEPYPLVVMDRLYNTVDLNEAATRLLGLVVADPTQLMREMNTYRAIFDPELFQPFIVDFERIGPEILARLQREALANPADTELATLVHEIQALPTVDESWKEPDLSRVLGPTLVVRLKKGDLEAAFFTMVTMFNAPQNITLQELRIESYFPYDDATRELCQQLASR